MAAERLADVDLSGIQLHDPQPRLLVKDSMYGIVQEDDIETGFGPIHVAVQGERGRPAIFTYHDIGLNSGTCFQGFFQYEDMTVILRHFTVYHINAPGQQEGALPLPQGGICNSESDTLLETMMKSETAAAKRASLSHIGDPDLTKDYTYPTLDQLGNMLTTVLQYYGLKTCIGFGVGAGANILARFALSHPEKVDGLCLINCSSSRSSWTEWGYQKLNNWYLKSGQLSAGTEEYLLWHWFGKKTISENSDLVKSYTDYIKTINPTNLAHFMDSYVKRTDLALVREFNPLLKKEVRNFRCPIMLVAGDSSPHLNQVIHMNGQLDPADSTWMKFECGGMVHEETPDKLCEAFRLFLQGMGYIPTLSKMSLIQKASRAAVGGAPSRGGSYASAAIGGAAAKPSAPLPGGKEAQTVC